MIMSTGTNTTSKTPIIELQNASKKCSDKDALLLRASGKNNTSLHVKKGESRNAFVSIRGCFVVLLIAVFVYSYIR